MRLPWFILTLQVVCCGIRLLNRLLIATIDKNFRKINQAIMIIRNNTLNSSNTWPNKGHYFTMSFIFSILVIYASLVPLNFRPLLMTEALNRFSDIPFLSLGIDSRADWVSNILLFVPVGYLWAGTFLVNTNSRVLIVIVTFCVVLFSVIFSLCIEFTQLWFPPRTVSQNDIFAESIGATIGGLLWCYIGQTVTDWIYSYTRQESRKKKIDWWLEIYMIGLVLYHFIPLDLTISSGELAHKFSQGKIRIIPFSGVELNLSTFYNWSKEIVIFIPVGIFFSIWRMNQKIKVRPMEILPGMWRRIHCVY